MEKYSRHILRVEKKSQFFPNIIRQIDVEGMGKKSINAEVIELQKSFNLKEYNIIEVKSSTDLRCF